MCFVIKTKVAGKNNTALVDEGANMCVLNVDWYEAKVLIGKEEFQVNGDVQTHVCLADQHEVPSYGIANVNVALRDAKGKQFVHPFCLMRLGKHNYAQILGFDWKYKYHCVTSLPEYELNIRKLNCVVSGYHYGYTDRQCALCGSGEVADEHHVILECPVTAGVRGQFLGKLEWGLRQGGGLPYPLKDNHTDPQVAHLVLCCLAEYSSEMRRRGLCVLLEGEDE